MLRNSWSAAVRKEVSNASAAWTSDSMGRSFRTWFGFAGSLVCVSVIMSKQSSAGGAKDIRRQILVWHNPRVVAFKNKRSFERWSRVQGTQPVLPLKSLNFGDERCLVKGGPECTFKLRLT